MNNDLIANQSGSTNQGVSMTILDAPARSDVPGRSEVPVPAALTPAGKPARPYRLHGTVLSVGALMWAAAIALYGADPSDSAVGAMVFGIGSGAFQIGLLFLLRVLRRTDALGTGKGARRVLVVENVFVGLAIASTIADAVRISDLSQPGWLLLDAFWPISMMGMFGPGHPDRHRRPLEGRLPLLAAGGRELGRLRDPDHEHLRPAGGGDRGGDPPADRVLHPRSDRGPQGLVVAPSGREHS